MRGEVDVHVLCSTAEVQSAPSCAAAAARHPTSPIATAVAALATICDGIQHLSRCCRSCIVTARCCAESWPSVCASGGSERPTSSLFACVSSLVHPPPPPSSPYSHPPSSPRRLPLSLPLPLPPPHHPFTPRRRYWPSKTSMSGASSTSTSPSSPLSPPSYTFHLLLIRHRRVVQQRPRRAPAARAR